VTAETISFRAIRPTSGRPWCTPETAKPPTETASKPMDWACLAIRQSWTTGRRTDPGLVNNCLNFWALVIRLKNPADAGFWSLGVTG